jgi:thymidine kinase
MQIQQKNTSIGSLEVICGPMFSGKSEELMRRLRRAKIAQLNVMAFKPSIDIRHSTEHVVSHDGNKLYAHAVTSPAALYEMVTLHDVNVIGIDEVQFFSKEIIDIICLLINEGKRIIAGGLDLDFRGVPFGVLPILLAISDKITKLNAICSICGREAHLSQRLVNGQPARYDDQVVLVGAQEAYQARCRGCFSIDKNPKYY